MARDMTERQFKAALERNGFAPELGGLWFRDTTGVCPNTLIGAVLDRRKGDIAKRDTIARLIAERKRSAEKTARAALGE